MWSVYTIIGYFLLALLIPTCWMALSVRRRVRGTREVRCPQDGRRSIIELDTWYAVRKHALGDPELLVARCSQWPRRSGCGQGCRDDVATPGS
jgi:hypothetical protein